MGSLVEFYIGIPKSAGDMKLMFICFAVLTHILLLVCFLYHLEHSDLIGGFQTQCRPSVALIRSASANSIFRTLRCILACLFYFE